MTYGTATLDAKKGRWRLEVEPHVAIRLKRVFGSLARGKTGPITLPHSPETCRDLLWFSDRYPLDIQPREALTAAADRQRERERMVGDILSGRLQPKVFDLAVPAREYQKVAATMALEMGSLLLADDVGTGKTASAICMLTDPQTRPALVVTLTHLPRQWAAEVRRFAPGLRTHILKKGTPYPLSKSEQQGQGALISDAPDVIVTNYHKLAGWQDALAGQVRTVIFDEVQELRRKGDRHNPSRKYAAAKAIADRADFKVGLSATPIYNYGGEMLNVMEVLKPGALGTRSEFFTEWCTGYQGDDKARIKDPRAFGTWMRDAGLMLRRTRADVGRELPELTRVVHEIDADLTALDRIQSSAAELARLILQTNPTAKGEKWRAAEELSWMVRQATGIAKAPFVADFVRLLVESGEKVVLFGWHREVYDIWRDRLKDLAPALYSGSESPNQKDEAKRRFVEGETPVLIMSLRSGAGLDGLQGSCRTVVFGELDWSPAVHTQAIGRVHRDGQGDPVVAYFLVAESGSDPIVREALGLKQAQSDGIVDPHGGLIEQIADGDHVRRLAAAYASLAVSPVEASAAI